MARIVLQQGGNKDVVGTGRPPEEPVASAQEEQGEEATPEGGEGE